MLRSRLLTPSLFAAAAILFLLPIVLSALPRRLGGAAGALLGLSGLALLILVGWAVVAEARARVQANAREFIELEWEVGALAVLLTGASLHGLPRVVRGERRADMLPA